MSVGSDGDAPLVERENEQRLLEAALEQAADGRGGVVLVEGEAGVGKTRLLRLAGALAEGRGMRVLRARGSELDRTFGFGLVRGLLERTVAELPELLTEGTEQAAELLGNPTSSAPGGSDLFSRLHGLYWLVAELAARQPLTIIADDLHWADTASLRWLVFMAQRVDELAMLMICATRPQEPGADQLLLDSLATAAGAVVRPAPLSPEGASRFVRARMPGAAQPFTTACHTATGGNPFLLGELVTEATAERVTGTAADAGHVPAVGSEGVGRAVRRRLRALEEPAEQVARAPPSRWRVRLRFSGHRSRSRTCSASRACPGHPPAPPPRSWPRSASSPPSASSTSSTRSYAARSTTRSRRCSANSRPGGGRRPPARGLRHASAAGPRTGPHAGTACADRRRPRPRAGLLRRVPRLGAALP